MNPDSDSPEPSMPKSRFRFDRRLFLAFTAMVGFGGIGLLTFYFYGVYIVDCTMSLGFMFPFPVLGVCRNGSVRVDDDVAWRRFKKQLEIQCHRRRVDIRDSRTFLSRG